MITFRKRKDALSHTEVGLGPQLSFEHSPQGMWVIFGSTSSSDPYIGLVCGLVRVKDHKIMIFNLSIVHFVKANLQLG